MNQEKKIEDLRFILNNKKINLKFKEDLLDLLNLVEKRLEDENKDLILKITEELLNFLLKKPLTIIYKDIIKKSCLIIKDLGLKDRKINRNIKASLLILNQDQAVKDAAEALKEITKKVEDYKKTTPKSYKLSKDYFENL